MNNSDDDDALAGKWKEIFKRIGVFYYKFLKRTFLKIYLF